MIPADPGRLEVTDRCTRKGESRCG
jgi:hypothetical protein